EASKLKRLAKRRSQGATTGMGLRALLFDVRHEERWTRRRSTMDHGADRPPDIRHFFDGPEELRTGDPRQRARREPNDPVVGAKGPHRRDPGVDRVNGNPLPAEKAMRTREPDLVPVPGLDAYGGRCVSSKLGVIQVEQDDICLELRARDNIRRDERWDVGRPRG